MAKYLDKSGVTYLWNKIKELFTDQSLNTKNKTYTGAINEINTKVGNLTGAFLWKGKFDTLPAVTDYEAGNVVGVGKKEYVLTVTEGTKAWEELGDEGSYLLKSVAEETYLKKAAGEVKTANLADNAVISTKLATGARKPIIITGDMTEVDEETYQKLSSQEGTDVILNLGDGIFVELQGIFNTGDTLILIFGYSQFDESNDGVISTYTITINTSAPHTLTLAVIGACEPVSKSTLTPVLQEIDLTGTDADRKAKLDKFETDWKTLTNAVNPRGARFIGKVNSSEIGVTTVLLRNNVNNNTYEGIIFSDDFSAKIQSVSVDIATGSITITPLFSHLEAITIYTDNTPEHMQANLDNIAAYEANLQALGVDITKGWNAPVKVNAINGISSGIFASSEEKTNTPYTIISGLAGEYPYIIRINKTSGVSTMWEILCDGRNYVRITTNAKSIISAINEINANAVHSDKLVPTLEAITIKTGNTPDDKAANVAAIKAYVDNLIALGVDVTKGYMIPICFSNTELGYVMYHPFSTGSEYTGIITGPGGASSNIAIEKDGYAYVTTHIQPVESSLLTTTAKTIVPAINEVNALAKSKQDKLTSGTNIKTVNGQSLLGSGDIAISGGGGSAPVLVDIDDISGSAGDSVPVDVFNKIANAASAKTPIFGYFKLVEGPKTTYEIIPLYVKNVSTPDTNGALSIQFIAENACNNVGIRKRSDTECIILISSSRSFVLDTSVDKSSTRGIQSSAVWKEIHSEPMTVNTAISGVTTLSSTDKHKILCYANFGTQQYNLPPSPVDGETFLFLKVKSGHGITIQSGTDNENIYDCSSGNSVVSKTIASSTKSKITVTYSSTVDKWFLMADDFIS